jgi:hypothetical protein
VLIATGANSYTWVNVGSGSTQTVSPTTSTTYTVLGSNNGCAGQDVITINVNALPVIQVVQSHSVLCYNLHQSGTLTASGAGSYNWSNGSVTPVIVVSPSVTTSYVVTGTDGNGCSNTKTVTQVVASVCAGVAEASAPALLQAFPNPFHSSLSLRNENGTKITVRVSDLTGRTVYQSVQESADVSVSTEMWAPGLYFIEARSNDQVYTLKMVKQ